MLLMLIGCLALLLLVKANAESCTGPMLYTQSGTILGKTLKTQSGREIYAFYDVPYAKPPVGDLRFRAPEPLKSWPNILDASYNHDVKCIQIHPIPSLINGQEDCLVLQIFIPKLPDYKSHKRIQFPVMVFVHGGSFLGGSGGQECYGPQKLLDRDVILINVNYRLGVFGFLSTGDDEAPGNAGLLDQVEALRWIQNNIEDYGGDPSKVLIFGESAGAASVIHLLLSPLTKGLFHGVIAQSGTALINELKQYRPLALTAKLAGLLQCPNDTSTSEMMACLRKKDEAEIQNGVEKMSLIRSFPPLFLPVVEHDHPGAFQSKDFQKVLEDGDFNKVPVISGINKDEAVLSIQPIIDHHGAYKASLLDELFQKYVRKYSVYNTDEAFAKIKQEYFDLDLNNETAFKIAFSNLLTDVVFKAPNDLTVRLLSPHVPTFMYVFEYRGKNWLGQLVGSNDNESVSHGDDILYLFEGLGGLQDKDHNVSQILIDMWTNFTAFGNPTPKDIPLKWETLTPNQFQYLRIAENFTMVKSEYRQKQMDFWNKVMPQFKNIEPDIQLPRFKQQENEVTSKPTTVTATNEKLEKAATTTTTEKTSTTETTSTTTTTTQAPTETTTTATTTTQTPTVNKGKAEAAANNQNTEPKKNGNYGNLLTSNLLLTFFLFISSVMIGKIDLLN